MDVRDDRRTRSVPAERIPPAVILFVMLLALLWGGNVVAIKIGLRGVPPLAAAGLRFAVALPLIVAWARVRGIPVLPRRSEAPRLLLLGLVFTIQIALINLGAGRTLAGRAAVFLNAYPIYVAFISHVFVPDDRLSARKVVGLLFACGGLLVVFGGSFLRPEGASFLGDLFVLLSGVLLSVLVVMISRLSQKTAPVRITSGEMVVGVPVFFLLSAIFEHGRPWRVSLDVALALGYQGVVVGAFCFLAWAGLLKRYSPTRLSVLFFSTPLWGLLASFLILGERVSGGLVAGGVLVAVGIYFVNRAPMPVDA